MLDLSSVQSTLSTENPDVYIFTILAGAAHALNAPTVLKKKEALSYFSIAYFEGTLIVIKQGQEINGSVRLCGPHTAIL